MKSTLLRLLAVGLLTGPATAHSIPIVFNGSLTGPIANSGVPRGWRILSGSPDTNDANHNVGQSRTDFGADPDPTPDGGTWIGLGRVDDVIETFGQTRSGFDVGTSYTLTWFAGNFGFTPPGYIESNAIEVLLDGVSIGSGPVLELGSGWFAQSLSFVATSDTHQIAFRLGLPNHSYMSIDGIAFDIEIPEPGTLALLGLGLFGLGLTRRRTN